MHFWGPTCNVGASGRGPFGSVRQSSLAVIEEKGIDGDEDKESTTEKQMPTAVEPTPAGAIRVVLHSASRCVVAPSFSRTCTGSLTD